MITKKEWIEFKKWRAKELKKVRKSKEFQIATKGMALPPPAKIVKRKFLWHEWEEKRFIEPFDYLLYSIKADNYAFLADLLLARVPDETTEACLNWLTSKKQK